MMSLNACGAQARFAADSAVLAVVPLLAIVIPVAACGSGGGGLDYPTSQTDVVVQVSVGRLRAGRLQPDQIQASPFTVMARWS